MNKIVGLHLNLFFIIILLSTKMRVRIVFQLLNQGGFVPFHQQVLLSSFVHDFLPAGMSASANWSFSGLKGQTKVTARGLYYNSQRVTLVFSSPSKSLTESFISGLFSIGSFGLAGLELQPVQVLEEIIEFSGNTEKYICISPMVVLAEGLPENELKQFIAPNTDSFADLLYESTMSRMESAGLDAGTGNSRFNFRPDAEYLKKAKESERKFSRIYSLEGFGNYNELRGYTLPFYLDAPPEVQRFIFESGFGEASRFGFGMVDLADKKERTRLQEIPVQPGREVLLA